jgi:hypothetical protein
VMYELIKKKRGPPTSGPPTKSDTALIRRLGVLRAGDCETKDVHIFPRHYDVLMKSSLQFLDS